MNDNRGIVLSSFTFDGRNLAVSGGISPVNLRHALLYWDKIDFPNNNIIGTGLSEEMELLAEQGIAKRTMVAFDSFAGNPGIAMSIMQAIAFEQNSKAEPGRWAVAQTNQALFVPEQYSKELKTIEVELYNSLPVPSEQVTIPEILEFKDRRRDELLAFRIAMDNIYLGVVQSNDIPRSKIVAIQTLESALVDLNRVADESWTSKLLSSLRVEVNVPNLVSNAILGSLAASQFGFSPAAGAAVGAATAALKFDMGVSRGYQGLTPEQRDFAYIFQIGRELKR